MVAKYRIFFRRVK